MNTETHTEWLWLNAYAILCIYNTYKVNDILNSCDEVANSE